MKKGLLLLLMFKLLFGYELIVKDKKDYELLQALGVECKEEKGVYVCVKSDDKVKLESLKEYLRNNVGVKAEVVDYDNQKKSAVSSVQTGYCIQVLSSKKASGLDDFFEKLKDLPYSRIEKIGDFYVLRVGEENSAKSLKTYLSKVKKIKKDAFIRKCDIIPNRIIKSNFNVVVNETQKDSYDNTLEKIQQILNSNKTVNNKIPKTVKESNDSQTVEVKKTKIKDKVKKSDINPYSNKYTKKSFKDTILSLYEKRDYKRVCDLLTTLNSFYNGDFDKIKKDACYSYYYEKGMEYLYIQPETAIKLFDKAIKFQNIDEVKFAKAIALMNEGKHDQAVKILRDIYKKDPNNSAVKLAYAKALFNLGNFKELDKINDHTLSFFKHYEMFKKANEYYKKGNYADAQKILEKLREYYPKNTRILLLSGNVEYKLGNYDLAYVFYKNVLTQEEKNIKALKGMRNLAVANKDIHSAVEISEMLKKLNYSDEALDEIMKEYFLLQADKLRKEKKYDEAIKMIEKARKYTKYSKDINLMTAKIYYDMGNYDKALEYYRMIKPKNASNDIKGEMVKLYVKKGDLESAKDIMQNSPNEIKVIYYTALAQKYFDEKLYTKANKNIANALALNPINPKEIYKLKARICYKLDNLQCAKKFYEKIKLETPEEKLEYALVLAKLGNKNLAYKVAESINNASKDILLKKATLMIQLGKTKEAKKIFEMVD
ncbi:MAG: tetratricopeptide repeat protein [Epsilonproteobacteria bacterium]|nr:tetratricopeptide repeat protein [Campylobacterota bacterium]